MGYYMAGGFLDLADLAVEAGRAIGSPSTPGTIFPAGPAHSAALGRIERAFQARGGGDVWSPPDYTKGWLPGGHEPGTGMWREGGPRRMNMANPVAMRRSMRRLSSFAKAARKLMPGAFPRRARARARPSPFKKRRK